MRFENNKNQYKSIKDENQYIEEIKRLNELINSKNERIELIQNQLDSQERFTSMIVHDMRNPSEAINNGLSQAKLLMNTDLQKIIDDLSTQFSIYKKKLKEMQQRESQLEY